MAENLKRTNQKIFASNSGSNGTTVYGSPARGNTQYSTDIKELMSSNAWETGKSAGFVAGKCPVWTDDNSIEYVVTKQLAYLMQKGMADERHCPYCIAVIIAFHCYEYSSIFITFILPILIGHF